MPEDGLRYPWAAPPGPGETVEIADGVLWARLPLPFRPDHLNAYLLDDGDGWSVVDTGLDTAAVRAAWTGLLAGALGGRPVRRVILTHHHPDHVGLAGWFQARGAELWATRTAWLTARMLTLDVQPLPSAETLAFWRGAGMAPDLLALHDPPEPERHRRHHVGEVEGPHLRALGVERRVHACGTPEGQRLGVRQGLQVEG